MKGTAMNGIDLDDADVAAFIRKARAGRIRRARRPALSLADRRRRDAAYSRTCYWRKRRPADSCFTMTLC